MRSSPKTFAALSTLLALAACGDRPYADLVDECRTNVSGQFSLIAANLRKGDAVSVTAEQVIEDSSERTVYAGSAQVTFQGTEISNVRIVLGDKPARVEPVKKPEDEVEISTASSGLTTGSTREG